MNFYGDYHTHTFYSDGRNSVSDVADGALSKGLKEVAITDHGFYNRFLSLTPEKYRKQQEEIEKQRKSIGDISLLQGGEADIVDASGTVDMTDEKMLNADILLAGFHRFVKSTSIKDFFGFVLYNGFVTDVFGTSAKKKAVATDAFVKAMEKALLDSKGPASDVVSNLSEYDLHFSELNKEELEMREKGSEQQKLANAPKATAEMRKRLQAITTGMLDAVFQDASQNGLDTTSPAFESFLTEEAPT